MADAILSPPPKIHTHTGALSARLSSRRRKSLARRRRRTKAARESAENAAEKGGVGNAAAA